MDIYVLPEDARFELQQLVARYANAFDLKDWTALGRCLADNLYTDYSDLRGTPPETLSREQFVSLRRSALQELQTHHLSGNVEIVLQGPRAALKVSMVIYRRAAAGETLNTHCLYEFGAEYAGDAWVINAITQRVFINDGNRKIHSGIVSGSA